MRCIRSEWRAIFYFYRLESARNFTHHLQILFVFLFFLIVHTVSLSITISTIDIAYISFLIVHPILFVPRVQQFDTRACRKLPAVATLHLGDVLLRLPGVGRKYARSAKRKRLLCRHCFKITTVSCLILQDWAAANIQMIVQRCCVPNALALACTIVWRRMFYGSSDDADWFPLILHAAIR